MKKRGFDSHMWLQFDMNVPFDREAVFAAVDASSKRFETYTEEERKEFVKAVREIREQSSVLTLGGTFDL